MVAEALARDTNRPYPPASNVVSVLHRLRSRNLPERIDNEFLRDAGIPESLIHRAAFALRFLGLVEDDAPTPALRAIATSTDEEYRDILSGIIRDAYGDVFAVVDPAQDSQDRIVNFFRRYTPASQRERMVNFFLAMCREAGIPTLDVPRQRPSLDAPRPKRAQPSKAASPGAARAPRTKTDGAGAGEGGAALPPGTLHPALELLVRSLPPPGTPMPDARRQQWLDMADAALAFVYPAEAEAGAEPEDGDGAMT